MSTTTNLKAQEVSQNTNLNYIQANTGLDQLDLAMTELRQVAVTADVNWNDGGSDQLVTSGVYKALRCSIIEFTGAQGAGKTFTVPANKKWYYVLNSCTGGFNTTFKGPTGTGIAIANAAKKKLYFNGSEMIDWTGI